MTVRDACVPLIDLIRELIADSESEWATDQRVQDALDANRDELRYHPLRKIETRASGGAISYLTFAATCGHWDEGVALVDGNYDSLTPSSSDYMVGRWEFATEPTGQRVYLTGYTYDVYATAADLLEQYAASKQDEGGSFTVLNGQFANNESGRRGPLELAKTYRRQQRLKSATLIRGDMYAS